MFNKPMAIIRDAVERVGLLSMDLWSKSTAFWRGLPSHLRILLIVIFCVACVNIAASLIKAIVCNRSSWKKKQDSELMYSFSAGSGQYQRRCIYRDAHRFVLDRRWTVFSFAGCAARIGDYVNRSRAILFLCSIIYLPLLLLGVVEMIMRGAIGVIVFFILNLAYFLCLVVLWVINLILTPLFSLLEKRTQETQHCPKCYHTFRLPIFECRYCGRKHADLQPGQHGLLFARCACGRFIPCASISKRKNMKSYCPRCNQALAGSNIKALTIQVVGGNSSGKTAFIAAFQHQYISAIRKSGDHSVSTSPEDDFRALERMYHSGMTEKSSSDQVHAYYILHNSRDSSDDGIVIYDVPDEIILSEQYERNPLNFAYSDGIVIIIDPLSVRSVRENCEATMGSEKIIGFCDDPTEDIIVHFINKYSEVAGRSAKRMTDTPVAVVIGKTDLAPIRRRIGMVKIKAEYSANQRRFRSLADARNQLCREYLADIGLGNALNNLDSVFSNVSCFPVSSIGHCADGSPFEPQNVIDPVGWLARQCQSNIKNMAALVEEEIR